MASGTRVYVGNLLAGVDKGELQKEFSRFGKLREVWVARNPPGFAFVEFFAYVDAERAVSSLDGRHLLGSKVTVQMSRKPLKRGRDGRMRQGAGPHRQGGRRPMPRPDMRFRGERNPPMSKPPPRAASPGYDPPLNRPRPVKPMNTKSYDLAKSRIAKKLTQRSRINVLRKRPPPAGKFTKTGRKLSQGGTLPVQKNIRSARTSSSDYEDDRPTKAAPVHKKTNATQKVAKIKKKKAVKKVVKHAQSRSMDRSSRSQSPYDRPPPRHVGPSTPPRSPRSWSPRRWTPSPPRRNTSPRPMINPPPMPLMRNRRSPPPSYVDKRRRNQSPVPRWSPSAVPPRYPSPPPRDNYYSYSPASEYNMPWRDPVYPYDERWQGEGMKHYPSQPRPRSRSPPSPPRERFERRGMMPGYFPDYWPPFPPIPPPPPPMDSRYLGSRQSPPPRYPSRDSPPGPSRQRRTPEKYRERSPVSPARSPNVRSKGKPRQRTRSDSSPESVVMRKGSKKYASPGVKLKRKQRRSYSNSPPPKRGGHISSDDSRSPSPKYEKWPQETKRRSRTPQKYRQSPPRRYRSASRSPGSVEYKRRNSYSDNSRSPTPRRGWNSTRSRPKSPSPQRWSKTYKEPSNYRSRSPSPLPDTRSQRSSNSLRKSYHSPPESRKASRRSLTPNSPPPRAYRSVTPSPPRSKYKGSRRR